jgi:hypothetical protein
VAIGQPGEAPQAHAERKVEPLDMAGAYLVLIRVAEHGQLFRVYYRGRAVAGFRLGAGVVFYELGEVHLHTEGERDIRAIVGKAVCR